MLTARSACSRALVTRGTQKVGGYMIGRLLLWRGQRSLKAAEMYGIDSDRTSDLGICA